MVSVNLERDKTMHTLLAAHINYETATQRRHDLVTHAGQNRLTRWARHDTDIGPVHPVDVGSILPFRTVTTVTSTTEHASARVA